MKYAIILLILSCLLEKGLCAESVISPEINGYFIESHNLLSLKYDIIHKRSCTDTIVTTSDTLKPIEPQNLDEVIVKASKTTTSNIAGSQFIKPSKLPILSVNMADNINLASGIKVRQRGGGLGSDANIVMNSYSGKAIRSYIDGIPVEFKGYALGAAPSIFFDRIELFNGFTPENISSDILGGLVNYCMESKLDSYLKMSYETGSWNLNRGAIRMKKKINKVYFGFDLFKAYADNDYKVSVLQNGYTRNYKLFNNTFKQLYAGFFIGLSKVKWANDIRLAFTFYDIRKEIPHNANMTTPYGKVKSCKKGDYIVDLQYKKRIGHFALNQFVGYARTSTQYIDTLKGNYSWNGTFRSNKNSQGESIYGGSMANKNNRNFFSSTKLKTFLNETNYLYLNLNYYNYYSTGYDDYAPKSSIDNKTDLLSYPAKYTKTLSSLGWSSYGYDSKLKFSLSLKHFILSSEGRELDPLTALLLPNRKHNSYQRFGIQNMMALSIGEYNKLKIGFNCSSRLPDLAEIYGNYSNILSNFSLHPENTRNINLSFNRTTKMLSFATNIWYRKTKHIVQMEQLNNYWIHKNIGDVAGYGFNIDLKYQANKTIKLFGNTAFNNVRYKRLASRYGNNLIDSRLRNTPFLQGNMGISVNTGKLSVSWLYSWVNFYYFTFIPKQFEKSGFAGLIGKTNYDEDPYSIIPTQNIHSLNLVYNELLGENFSLAFNVRNIFNNKVFDNYRTQNAGRTFTLKISYSINQL